MAPKLSKPAKTTTKKDSSAELKDSDRLRNCVATLNNYTEEDEEKLKVFIAGGRYGVDRARFRWPDAPACSCCRRSAGRATAPSSSFRVHVRGRVVFCSLVARASRRCSALASRAGPSFGRLPPAFSRPRFWRVAAGAASAFLASARFGPRPWDWFSPAGSRGLQSRHHAGCPYRRSARCFRTSPRDASRGVLSLPRAPRTRRHRGSHALPLRVQAACRPRWLRRHGSGGRG